MRVIVLIVIAFSLLFTSCRKKYTGDESDLYGTWVKGSNFGDTLWFGQKNNQSFIRMTESFNAGMPVYSEKAYRFSNGNLGIQTYAPYSMEYRAIDSFTWTQAGTEFKIQGIQLFLFMSSSGTYFTYHKIN